MRAFAERAPHGYAERMGALRAAADAFAEALRRGRRAGLSSAAADACHQALAALGAAAELPIVTPEVARAAELARSLGGAAKPSGAGGGDLGVAFFAEARAARAFAARCPEGVLVLDLQLGATGAYRRAAERHRIVQKGLKRRPCPRSTRGSRAFTACRSARAGPS